MGLIHTRASKKRDRAEAGLARAETKLIRAQAKTARQQEAQAPPADQPVVMAIPEGFFGASAKPKTFHENNLAAKMTFQAQRAGYKMTQGQAVAAIRAGHTTFAEVQDELNKTAAGRMS